MSTLRITMSVQALDFNPLTRGQITVRYNDGNQDYDLVLRLTTGISTTGYFSEVAWIDGFSGEDAQQAINYRNAFNRDFKGIGLVPNGGLQVVKLFAELDGDDVLITSLDGTFDQALCSYNGNVLSGVTFTATNTTPATPLLLGSVQAATGGCSTIDYTFSASGGTSPYSLTINGSSVLTGWDGSPSVQALPRGAVANVVLADDAATSVVRNLTPPRALTASEFTIVRTQYQTFTDLLVEWATPVNGITPLEYSIDPQGTVSGANWQGSNAFAGVLPGIYEVFIRDSYLCSVRKTVIISETQDPSMDGPPAYFEVMHGNSVIFSEAPVFGSGLKKNFDNTLSFNERSPVTYQIKEYFDPSDEIAVQFKSSYPFHVVTLHDCDGGKTDIPILTIQENLGVQEKVDCEIFPLDGGGSGVYFDGGNEYVPGSTTVLGPSEHTTFLPYWVAEGQIVVIDGLGTYVIQGTGYDSVRGKDYFIISAVVPSEATYQVEVTYNKQIYNLFEFRFSMTEGQSGRIVIEKGQDFDNIVGNPWASELLVGRMDDPDDLLIQWSDTKNKGGIVFQSNISFLRRMPGYLNPVPRGDADVADTDSRAYSLRQTAYMDYDLSLEGISAKEAYQLCIATGLEGFRVNNLVLARREFPSIERLGSSNLYNFTCRLSTGADDLAIQKDEVVLDVSTGVEGGGSPVDQPYVLPLYDNRVRLRTQGGFVTVSGDFVVIE